MILSNEEQTVIIDSDSSKPWEKNVDRFLQDEFISTWQSVAKDIYLRLDKAGGVV